MVHDGLHFDGSGGGVMDRHPSSGTLKPDAYRAAPLTPPRRGTARPLHVEIVPLAGNEHGAAAARFWRLAGELAAAVMLDGVDGPWGTAAIYEHERLAA